MARLGHTHWYFNCSRTHLTHVQLYRGHKLFLETQTILQHISCTYFLAFPRISSHFLAFPRISSHFLAFPRISSHFLTFPHISSHFLTFPHISSHFLTFPHISSHFLPHIFLWLNVATYAICCRFRLFFVFSVSIRFVFRFYFGFN